MTSVNELSSQETAFFSQYLKKHKASSFATQSFGRRVFVANFVSEKARGRFQIEVPEQGDFTLKIQLGNDFDILDNDATDGLATLALPQAVYDTVFHLQRNRNAHTELQVQDSLYQVEDTLTSDKYKWIDLKRFLRLGVRPVPVPENWHSDDEDVFTLRFQAKNLEGFQMLWVQSGEPAPVPPGIAEIDAQGGDVVLPGVGHLAVPAGAVSEPTTFVLKEILQVPAYEEPSLEGTEPPRSFVSGVVKLFPESLQLHVPAQLSLVLDTARLGNNDIKVTEWSRLIQVENQGVWTLPLLLNDTASLHGEQLSLTELGVYARTMPGFIHPNDGYRPWQPASQSEDFRVQQIPSLCGAGHEGRSNPIQIFVPDSGTGSVDLSQLVCFALQTYRYYEDLATQAGGNSPNGDGIDGVYAPQIPVYLHNKDENPRTHPRYAFPGFLHSYIKMSGQPTGGLPEAKEALAHELWHAFQYANLNAGVAEIAVVAAVNIWGTTEWILEGPAVHMGAKALLSFDGSEPINYFAHLETNQAEMKSSLYNRGYSTAAFFTHMAKSEGEIVLARLAANTSPLLSIASIDDALQSTTVQNLYKEFGYAAEKAKSGASFLIPAPANPAVQETIVMDLDHSRASAYPLVQGNLALASTFVNIVLDSELAESQGDYKLFIKHNDNDPDEKTKIYAVPYTKISPDKGVHLRNPKSKVEVESTWTEISNFGKYGQVDGVILIIANGSYSGVTHNSLELALEQEDKSRVEVSTSSRYSQGSVDPVTVNLTIRDIAGKPANGRYFVGVDAGSFTVTSPIPAGPFDNAGAFVDVIEGRVTLEYRAKGVTKSFGELVCGGSEPCKANSVRFKVSGCDYKYYGKGQCPILGPGKDLQQDGVESDEGRIYTTWFDGQVSTQKREYLPNGNKTRISLSGLKDNAGRSLKTGFWLFLDNPYYGNLYRTDGSSSGVWTQIAVQNGSLSFQYEAANVGVPCWPFLDLKDFVTIDDSRYRESWRRIALEVTYKEVVDCESE